MGKGKWYLSFARFDVTVGHYVAHYLPLEADCEALAQVEAKAKWNSNALMVQFFAYLAQGGLEYPPKKPQLVYVRGLFDEGESATVTPKKAEITLAQAGQLNDMGGVASE